MVNNWCGGAADMKVVEALTVVIVVICIMVIFYTLASSGWRWP